MLARPPIAKATIKVSPLPWNSTQQPLAHCDSFGNRVLGIVDSVWWDYPIMIERVLGDHWLGQLHEKELISYMNAQPVN